jgi:hypothetical protein
MSGAEKLLITCVLYRGGGIEVLKALRKRGIDTANLHHARGSAIGDPADRTGLPASFAKEIVTVTVDADRADELFEFIFDTAQIDRPHGGFLYMQKIRHLSPYALPNVPEEPAA